VDLSVYLKKNMKIKILPISLVALFLIVFIIFFKGLKNSNIYVPNINLDKKIPFFSTELFDSNIKIHSNEIFVGDQFYLLNIWSSWCVPCRAEHVFLMDLGKEKNLKLVGLNYKDNVMNAKNFLRELNNPYEIILTDNNGLVAIEWGAYGVPETFLIHKKKIIKKIVGPLNSDSTFIIRGLIKK